MNVFIYTHICMYITYVYVLRPVSAAGALSSGAHLNILLTDWPAILPFGSMLRLPAGACTQRMVIVGSRSSEGNGHHWFVI